MICSLFVTCPSSSSHSVHLILATKLPSSVGSIHLIWHSITLANIVRQGNYTQDLPLTSTFEMLCLPEHGLASGCRLKNQITVILTKISKCSQRNSSHRPIPKVIWDIWKPCLISWIIVVGSLPAGGMCSISWAPRLPSPILKWWKKSKGFGTLKQHAADSSIYKTFLCSV